MLFFSVIMLNVVMLSVAFMLSIVMLNVVMLSVLMLKILNEIISLSDFIPECQSILIEQRLLSKTENELA